MRDIEELKKVLLENFDEYFDGFFVTGLCDYFYDMHFIRNIISFADYSYLKRKIREHEDWKEDVYIWKEGLKQPRIEWVKNLK